MSKSTKYLFTSCSLLLIGMATWSYQSNPHYCQVNTKDIETNELTRNINGVLLHLIKKEPVMLYKLNSFIESSAFLKSQKRAYLKMYSDEDKKYSSKHNQRMLLLYIRSQKSYQSQVSAIKRNDPACVP